jgi:hypothetical protein
MTTYAQPTMTTKISGTTIKLRDGKDYTVPPLTVAQAKALAPKIKLIVSPGILAANEEALDACLEISVTALIDNYPEKTPEELVNLLDLRNCWLVLRAAIGFSETASEPEPTFVMPPMGTLPN